MASQGPLHHDLQHFRGKLIVSTTLAEAELKDSSQVDGR